MVKKIEMRAVYDHFGPNNVVICTWPNGEVAYLEQVADFLKTEEGRLKLTQLAASAKREYRPPMSVRK